MAGLLVSKASKEREIAALRADFAAKLAANQRESERATANVIAGKEAQMVGAATSFAGQDVVFRSILAPTRTDRITHNLAMEGWQALGHIQPTFEAMKAMNERLKKELDERATSIADLERNHQHALVQNAALAEATKRHEAALEAERSKRAEIERAAAAAIDAKQQELIAAQEKVITAERARADDAKARTDEARARQAQLAKLSWGAGILAALCLAGAIWSPVFKSELGIAAIVLGGAAVVIPFITGWMIFTAVGVAVAALVGWAALKHRKEERLSDGLVLAMNRVKDESAETWAKVGPVIRDSLGKYVQRDGKTVVRPDKGLEALVDRKLMAYEQLGPSPIKKAPVMDASPATPKSPVTTL